MSSGTLLFANSVVTRTTTVASALQVSFSGATISNSALFNNHVTLESPGYGTIWNSISTMTIINSTISGNRAEAGIAGITNDGDLTLINSTIAGNHTALDIAAGIESGYGDPLRLQNTIIAGNTNHNCEFRLPTHDLGGNFADDDSCALTTGSNTDPMLAPLSGGYHLLLPGSPALDSVNCATAPATDQRGIARPQGAACDAGAIEMQPDELGIVPQATAVPPLNTWHTETDEDRAYGWNMPDDVYGTVLMWEGAWQYNPGGIPQELVDYGVIVAVDVWILSEGGTPQFDFGGYQQICLLGEGRMIFMDATQSPRPLVEITPVEFINGYTCGWIPNAGTVVLIPPEPQG